MNQAVTVRTFGQKKAAGTPIVCLTAYDATGGLIAESAGVDCVLVGDSVGNTVLGFETTVPVTLEHIQHHLRAVRSSCKTPLLVADLPFGTYNESVPQAVRSAVSLMQAGANAVKLEGDYLEEVRAITKAGIPVMGHVGFTPQSVHAFGGFRMQGKQQDDAERILAEAIALQEAGCFAIVLELIPADLSQKITAGLTIPTIGIGAGPHCDGQIQVFHDLLGLVPDKFRHAARYAEGLEIFVEAVKGYCDDVRDRSFNPES